MRAPGLGLFLAVTFGFSWAIGALIWQTGGLAGKYAVPLLVIYMAGPALGGIVAAGVHDRGRRLTALGLQWRPNMVWLLAFALPFIIVVLSVLVSVLAPGIELASATQKLGEIIRARGTDPDSLPMSLDQLMLLTIFVQLPLGIAINAIVLLTEELGWRGWLWDRWRSMGFWRGNLAIGLLWGVWHAPIIVMGHNYPGMPLWGPVLMVVFSVLLSPLIGWLREYGRSVLSASIFHGGINALGGFSLLFLSSADMPWRGIVGFGGFAVLLAFWVPLYWHQKQNR